MQKAVKYSSLSSYMLKPSHSLTQGFENNKTAHEKLFKHICNFGSREEWRQGIIVVSSYLGVDITKDQCHLLNPTPLDCIVCYTMEDSVGDRALKRLSQRRMKFIDDSILSYCSIIISPKRLEQIRQAIKLASVLFDLGYDRIS